MPSSKRKFGDAGEKIAEKYLEEHGYEIMDRNYRKPYGEIDLIVKKNDVLVFVEVKTRDMKHADNFLPEQSVNRLKIQKIQKMCQSYLLEKRYNRNQNWQIDVIGISVNINSGKAKIKHMENAVWETQY